ncbi:MAG: radical SAM protein [Planctomycetota bacterium]
MPPEVQDVHQARLERWLERHPGSAHRRLGLDELESLKRENDRRAEHDQRERPEVCTSYPSFLTIGNTHKCNLTCQMCFKQLDDVENMTLPDMGLERFERAAHELFPHLRTVALSVTGEPLVSRTILDELELLATYGVRASITSNAMPFSKTGLIEALMPATDTLTVSMDGASAPTFDAIRRRADFDRVVKNIRLFDEARDQLPTGAFRPRLHFNHILQHRNLTELPQLVELAHRLNVDQVSVEHVYVHEGLNPADSILPHKRLANEVFERARESATRLGVDLHLPDPFDVAGAPPDLPYEPLREDVLRAQAKERLKSVRFDPQIHERWDEDARYRALVETRDAGGGNPEYVERLLDERALLGHLRWGVPQLGESLIPDDRTKPSECTYAWRESFLEYNGIIAPCCNPAVDAARVLGHFDEVESFLDVWNGENYRRLRRSLSTGSCYRFCRTCYLFEPPDEADWGTNETWVRVGGEVAEGELVEVGRVPPGKRIVLREVASDPVPADGRLEIFAGEALVADVAAESGEGGAYAFARALGDIQLSNDEVVRVRCTRLGGSGAARVRLIAFVV